MLKLDGLNFQRVQIVKLLYFLQANTLNRTMYLHACVHVCVCVCVWVGGCVCVCVCVCVCMLPAVIRHAQ